MSSSPQHFSFTNHFNRSLLKNRIEMMNRQKSSFWALGKYAFFVGMLWLSAAFTKPYRQQIAAQIVQQVPELEEVLEVKSNKSLPKLRGFQWETPIDSSKFQPKELTAVPTDTVPRVSQSKYVVYTSDQKLHFLITAKTSFEEMIGIRREFEKNDVQLEVLEWQMDSMGRYLQKVAVVIHGLGAKVFKSSGQNNVYQPMKPIAGILTLKPQNEVHIRTIIGNVPHLQYLKLMAELDEQSIAFDRRWTNTRYAPFILLQKMGLNEINPSEFLKKNLKKYEPDAEYYAFGIVTNADQKDKLKVSTKWRNARFRLNDNHALLADIEDVDAEAFSKAVMYSAYNKTTKKHEVYIYVYTQK